jgi:hypothetical protein
MAFEIVKAILEIPDARKVDSAGNEVKILSGTGPIVDFEHADNKKEFSMFGSGKESNDDASKKDGSEENASKVVIYNVRQKVGLF